MRRPYDGFPPAPRYPRLSAFLYRAAIVVAFGLVAVIVASLFVSIALMLAGPS